MTRFFCFLLVISFFYKGCIPSNQEISFDPNLELRFSTDTVSFDTLLSERRSSTKRLTIYNPNQSSILLSEIRLAKNDASDYSVVINGKPENSVFNQELQGGDSLLILIELTIQPKDIDELYLVKDSMIVSWNGNYQDIKLVAWGQDTKKMSNEVICTTTWSNERPFIISDTVLVKADCLLTIEKGTIVYFENDASLFIQGTIHAIGDTANHIVFRNARLDGVYDEVPGQWNGIYILEGSTGNLFSYTEIFNGQIGLRVGTPDEDTEPDVVINNTVIHNMSDAGILAFTSDLAVTNTLVYNCANYLAGHFIGGNYTYRHCTFSNDQSSFTSQEPSVQFSDNVITDEGKLLVADLNFELTNNIIWGKHDEELIISNGGGSTLTATITTNIIRSGEALTGNFTSREWNFPGFKNEFPYDYTLDSLAFAIDQGSDVGVTIDLVNVPRGDKPDIGAYERVD